MVWPVDVVGSNELMSFMLSLFEWHHCLRRNVLDGFLQTQTTVHHTACCLSVYLFIVLVHSLPLSPQNECKSLGYPKYLNIGNSFARNLVEISLTSQITYLLYQPQLHVWQSLNRAIALTHLHRRSRTPNFSILYTSVKQWKRNFMKITCGLIQYPAHWFVFLESNWLAWVICVNDTAPSLVSSCHF